MNIENGHLVFMEFSVPYEWVEGPGVGTVQRRFFQSNYVEPTEWSREHLAPWIDAPAGLEKALGFFHGDPENQVKL